MTQFTEEEGRRIIATYNCNKDTGASPAKYSRTIVGDPATNHNRPRFFYSLAAKGYTATQIEEHIIKACTSQVYNNIYDLLTNKSLKATGTAPQGQPQEPQPQPARVEPQAAAIEPQEPQPTVEPSQATVEPPQEPQPQATGGALETLLVQAAAPYIREEIQREVQQAAASGAIEKPLTIITPTGKVTTTGKHEVFAEVLSAIANNMPLYLYGPAGSGKNVICHQVAEALNLDFYYTNSVTQEYKLSGYMDAYGNFSETPFYKAFKYGGLFMLDELDASIPEVLTLLNGALSDGLHVFGNNEVVHMHKDFRCIAAGNTFGRGATAEYTARCALDESTLNRFSPKEVGYSRKIENTLADSETVEFCRAMREACKRAGIPHIVSYRNIINLGKLAQIWPLESAVKSAVVGTLSSEDLYMIKSDLPQDNKYTAALAACL